MSLGPAEILVIFVVALLVFGPTRLPEVGRQVGRGMREIRKFQQTLKGDLDDVLGDDSSDIPAGNPVEAAPAEPAPTLPPREHAVAADVAPEATRTAPSDVTADPARGPEPSELPPTTPPA